MNAKQLIKYVAIFLLVAILVFLAVAPADAQEQNGLITTVISTANINIYDNPQLTGPALVWVESGTQVLALASPMGDQSKILITAVDRIDSNVTWTGFANASNFDVNVEELPRWTGWTTGQGSIEDWPLLADARAGRLAAETESCVFQIGDVKFSVPPGAEIEVGGAILRCPADAEADTNNPQTEDQVEGPGFGITGAPEVVQAQTLSSRYVNTIVGTERFLAEPGVLTADSSADCGDNVSCWAINPDRQYILNDLVEEGSSVREDAWTMYTGAHGVFELPNEVKIEVEAAADHTWLVLFRGKNPGDGDLNTPVTITDFDPGFALVTHLPIGARVSEDYFLQNVEVAHTERNCGNDGCESVSALFYDLNTGGWVVITQPTPTANWLLVATNIATPA